MEIGFCNTLSLKIHTRCIDTIEMNKLVYVCNFAMLLQFVDFLRMENQNRTVICSYGRKFIQIIYS